MEHLPWIALVMASLCVGRATWNRMKGRRFIGDRAFEEIRGRKVALAPVATPLRMLIRASVPSSISKSEMRARLAHEGVRRLSAATRSRSNLVLTDVVKSSVVLIFAPRRGVDARVLAQDAVEFVIHLETSRAQLDAEGSPEGAPVAVRATGNTDAR